MSQTKSKPKTIEAMYQELKGIVEEFEQEEIDLEKSLKKFEAGLKLAEELKARLEKLKNEVEEIAK